MWMDVVCEGESESEGVKTKNEEFKRLPLLAICYFLSSHRLRSATLPDNPASNINVFDAVMTSPSLTARWRNILTSTLRLRREARNSRIGTHSLAVARLLAIQGGRVMTDLHI